MQQQPKKAKCLGVIFRGGRATFNLLRIDTDGPAVVSEQFVVTEEQEADTSLLLALVLPITGTSHHWY